MSLFFAAAGEAAWMAQLERGTPRQQAEAAVHLAVMTAERGDARRAQRLLRSACHEGDPVWAPRAAFELGQMLADAGDRIESAAAFQLAAGLSRPAVTPDVHSNLAARWAALGRFDDAEAGYVQVVDAAVTSNDPFLLEEAAVAAFRLGDLRVQCGDREGAEAAYLHATRSGHEEATPRAALALASLHGDESSRAVIVDELLEFVIELDHPDCSPQAALVLGLRRESAGERAAALHLYDAVCESEHPQFAVEAGERMVRLLDSGAERYVQDVLERAVLYSTFEPDGDSNRAGDLVSLQQPRCLRDLVPAMHKLNLYYDLCIHEEPFEPATKLNAIVADVVGAISALVDPQAVPTRRAATHTVTVTVTVTPTIPQVFMVECTLAHQRLTRLVMPALDARVSLNDSHFTRDLVTCHPFASTGRTLVLHDGSHFGDIGDTDRGGDRMATNPPSGDGHRKGAVRNRSQTQAPNGNYVKRDTRTGKFMDQKQDGTPFKGVRREK